MNKKIIALICLILSSVLIISSCSIPTVQAKDLLEEYRNPENKATPSISEVSEDFKKAFADFSFNLFREVVTQDNENELFSPLSAILCLAMVANGADKETKTEMEDVFGMDIDSLNENLYLYTKSLYSADDCVLNLANSIWFRNEEGRLKVNEEFLKTNAKWYDSQVFSEPFDDETLNKVNKWCEEQTDGMIKEMFDKLDEDAVMLLLNALVFDAKWAEEIKEEEENPSQFTNYDGKGNQVQMLSFFEKDYLSGDEYKGFTKDYIGNRYSFVALLPDENIDIYDFINSIDGEKWLSIWNSKKEVDIVDIRLPVFSYELEMGLVDPLKDLGMVQLFNTQTANLERLGKSSRGNLYCSSVRQKVFIELTRKGTKAAAVTEATISDEAYMEPPELQVYLDRPFVYALVDNSTGLPFFIGAITHLDN